MTQTIPKLSNDLASNGINQNQQKPNRFKIKLKNSLAFTFLLCIAGLNSLHAQTWLYAEQDGGDKTYVNCKDIAADNSPMGTGNHYTTGDWVGGEITLSGKVLSSEESSFYVAKYGPMSNKGDIKWVVQGSMKTDPAQTPAGGPGGQILPGNKLTSSVTVKNIEVDKAGNSYVVGEFVGNGILSIKGGPSLIGFFSKSNFIAKFDPDGKCMYLRYIATQINKQGAGPDLGGLAVDDAGNAYVSGLFLGDTAFGGFYGGAGSIVISDGALTSAWGTYIAKFNTIGLIEWVHQSGSPSVGTGSSSKVSASPSGDCYLTGSFYNNAYFGALVYINAVGIGGTTLVAGDNKDGYLAKYDTKGNFKWVQQIQNVNLKSVLNPSSIVTGADTDGNIYTYISGTIGDQYSNPDPVDFGGIVVIPNENSASFLAKYDESGAVQWAKIVGGILYPDALSIDNKYSTLYMAGYNYKEATFDFKTFLNPDEQTYSSPYTGYVVGYNTKGAFSSWYKSFDAKEAGAFRLASDNHNSCYMSGTTHKVDGAMVYYETSGDLSLDDNNTYKQCVALLNINEKAPAPNPPGGGTEPGKKTAGSNMGDSGIDQRVSVYPNPVIDLLKLSNVKEGSAVSIVNSDGRVMYQDKAFEQLDVSRWPSGVYVVTANEQQVKFIKQ